jgi:O-antigen ligase
MTDVKSKAIPLLHALLIFAGFALLSTHHLVHYPVGIMSLLGIYQLVRDRGASLRRDDARNLLIIFACIWLPMLLSLPDAVAPQRSGKTVLSYLHFLPAGLYVVAAMRYETTRRLVVTGVIILIAFWCLDALLQLGTGKDLIGRTRDGPVLTGIFHKQLLGLVLALFTPLTLIAIHRLAVRSKFAWLLLIPVLLVILFSLKRSAWVMFTLAVLLFIVYLILSQRTRWKHILAPVAIVIICTAGVISLSPTVGWRADSASVLLSPSAARLDEAIGGRWTLWRTASSIWRDNWFNGIGPRGYRYVYRDYAKADDFWIERGASGQTHPHLMLVEVMAESGIIGLLGYLAALTIILRMFVRTARWNRGGVGWYAVTLVAWFPLNAHLAFYGSYWSSIAWLGLAVALGLSAVVPGNKQQAGGS